MDKSRCSHYTNFIFLKCHDHHIDKHLHCGSCGMYLNHSIKLTEAINRTVMGYNSVIWTHRGLCTDLIPEKN